MGEFMGNLLRRKSLFLAGSFAASLLVSSAKAASTDFSTFAEPDTTAAASFDVLAAPASSDITLTPINTPPVIGDGKPDVIYDPATGDLKFNSDGYAQKVVEVLLHSEGSKFTPQSAAVPPDSYSADTLDHQNGSGFTSFDFGNVLPTGLTSQQVLADMTTFSGSVDSFGLGAPGIYINGDNAEHFYDIIAGPAPEPTSLALAGVAAVGLLGRKRRKSN